MHGGVLEVVNCARCCSMGCLRMLPPGTFFFVAISILIPSLLKRGERLTKVVKNTFISQCSKKPCGTTEIQKPFFKNDSNEGDQTQRILQYL